MSKIQELKSTYIKDADTMANKARFGYFSLLPSHTAAHTDFAHHLHPRQQDGRVKTEPRQIYPGTTSTGTLRKNYFSYAPSAFTGSPYLDPGKHDRMTNLQQSKKWQEKDKYKPASLNKTIINASYEYISPYDAKKDAKRYRDSDGKVITKSPNMQTSPSSKLDFQRIKKHKYLTSGVPQKLNLTKNTSDQQKKEPWKGSNPSKQVFTSNKQTYFEQNLKKEAAFKQQSKLDASHDEPFKPSCVSRNKSFNPVVYKQEGVIQRSVKKEVAQNQKQAFKLVKVEHNSKPTPSISCSKTNLLRHCR